jgi:hypothetical protein
VKDVIVVMRHYPGMMDTDLRRPQMIVITHNHEPRHPGSDETIEVRVPHAIVIDAGGIKVIPETDQKIESR